MDYCELRFYNTQFEWLGVVNTASSIQFTRELYGGGTIEIHMPYLQKDLDKLLAIHNTIMINRDQTKTAMITNYYIKNNGKKETVVIYGKSADFVFGNLRFTVPDQGCDFDKASGNAETVLKHYFNKHIINPVDEKRKISHIQIANDQMRGPFIEWQSRYKQLFGELRSIGEKSQTGFCALFDLENNRWLFDIIEGDGKTVLHENPVVFSTDFMNVKGYKFTYDANKFRNTAYIGGKGEGVKRKVTILNNENKGVDRYETFIDLPSIEDQDLLEIGKNKLETGDYKMVHSLEAEILNDRVFQYEKDYFLGDTVTVQIKPLNMQMNVTITGVKEIWEERTGKALELRFGEKIPSLLDHLKKHEEVI